METENTFSNVSSIYDRARPSYSAKLINDLYSKYGVSGASTIADIGAGTGKFSRLLLERGSFVYLIEPNEDMQKESLKELKDYKNFKPISADSSNTTLPDESVDFITAAQAFHWFDTKAFIEESKRILKKNSKTFLIWNIRDERAPINKKTYSIFSRYCPRFKGFGGGIKEDDERIIEYFDGRYEKLKYPNSIVLNREEFLLRNLSGSYSLQEGDKNYSRYKKRLESLFDEFSDGDVVTIPNESILYVGSVK